MILFSLNLLALWCARRLVWVRVRDILTSSSNQSRPFIEERKLALTDQLSFVLVRPYYLTLIHSISQNVLPPRSFLSLSSAPLVHRFSLSHLDPASNHYYPIAISLARSSIFPEAISLPLERGNRPNADAAGAQRSPRPSPHQVRSLCYICNRKLYEMNDEVNRSLQNAFDLLRVSRFSPSVISFAKKIIYL